MSLLDPLHPRLGHPQLGRARLSRALRPVRRTLLRRRRALAALCAGVAVLAGLQATAAPPPPTRAVRVLARDVAAGAVLTGGDLRTVEWAPDTVPDDVVDDPVGRAVAGPVSRGEPVTEPRLVGAALSHDAPGRRAMPVRFPDSATATLLRVGDVVDVVAVDPQGGAPSVVTAAARVLAVPAPVAGGAATDGLPGRLAVLGVDEADVTAVADASVRLFLTWSYAH